MYQEIPINTNLPEIQTPEIVNTNSSSYNSVLIWGGIILGVALTVSTFYIYKSYLSYDEKELK